MRTIDARGLSCPQPAFLTKEALAEMAAGELEVLVDNETSRDNVARCARHARWEVAVEDLADGGFKVVLRK